MKTIGSLRNTAHGMTRFHVHFDDGMTITLREKSNGDLEYDSMVSVGLESYFLKKGKWPKGANLKKRIELGVALIEKNRKNNRYRIKEDKTK